MVFKKHNNKYYIVDASSLNWTCIQSRNENQISFDFSDNKDTAEDIINADWDSFDNLDELIDDAVDYFGIDKFSLFENFIGIIGL